MTIAQRASPQLLRREVETWLCDHGFKDDYSTGGHKLLSPSEWAARGERFGNEAGLTIISEGDLYGLWNADPCCDREPLNDLLRLANDLGYYLELGFSWSLHFIPD